MTEGGILEKEKMVEEETVKKNEIKGGKERRR
jgi:hypothetical protein